MYSLWIYLYDQVKFSNVITDVIFIVDMYYRHCVLFLINVLILNQAANARRISDVQRIKRDTGNLTNINTCNDVFVIETIE